MNIKFLEHFLGEKITIEIRFILVSLIILFFSYTPIYFSYFLGSLLLYNCVFFSLYNIPIQPTFFALFLVGIGADLRFDMPLGFFSFNFILFSVISAYVHERMRHKKYYFLWGLNAVLGSFLYIGEYLLKCLQVSFWFDIRYLFVKLLLVIAIYPGITLVFSKLAQRLFGPNAS